LRSRVFWFLADDPNGVRLVEIERRFRLSRLEASRVVKSLIGDGKVKKRERFYYAT